MNLFTLLHVNYMGESDSSIFRIIIVIIIACAIWWPSKTEGKSGWF